MKNFEKQYLEITKKIIDKGIEKKSRNGTTYSLFGETLDINLEDGIFPLLTSRQIFYKGALGEFAALFRKPKNVKDFEKFGCNYWKLWIDNEDGDLRVDYGNKWLDFNGVNQIEQLIDKLKNNPDDRRMIVTGWDPSNLENLSLPCCHFQYQFYVREGKLDMIWNQRSADWMIGVPSDIILAAIWIIILAKETGLKPGNIKMLFGDTHIYEEHIETAKEHLNRKILPHPTYNIKDNVTLMTFLPNDFELINYEHSGKLKYELKG